MLPARMAGADVQEDTSSSSSGGRRRLLISQVAPKQVTALAAKTTVASPTSSSSSSSSSKTKKPATPTRTVAPTFGALPDGLYAQGQVIVKMKAPSGKASAAGAGTTTVVQAIASNETVVSAVARLSATSGEAAPRHQPGRSNGQQGRRRQRTGSYGGGSTLPLMLRRGSSHPRLSFKNALMPHAGVERVWLDRYIMPQGRRTRRLKMAPNGEPVCRRGQPARLPVVLCACTPGSTPAAPLAAVSAAAPFLGFAALCGVGC